MSKTKQSDCRYASPSAIRNDTTVRRILQYGGRRVFGSVKSMHCLLGKKDVLCLAVRDSGKIVTECTCLLLITEKGDVVRAKAVKNRLLYGFYLIPTSFFAQTH